MQNASAGDIIYLAGGSYGNLNIANFNYSGSITVKAADLNNIPVFNGVYINNCSNITFDGIKSEYFIKSGDYEWTTPNFITSSNAIKFVNSEICW